MRYTLEHIEEGVCLDVAIVEHLRYVGATKTDMSNALEVSRSAVTRWTCSDPTRARRPSVDMCERIAQWFRGRMEELGLEENKTTDKEASMKIEDCSMGDVLRMLRKFGKGTLTLDELNTLAHMRMIRTMLPGKVVSGCDREEFEGGVAILLPMGSDLRATWEGRILPGDEAEMYTLLDMVTMPGMEEGTSRRQLFDQMVGKQSITMDNVDMVMARVMDILESEVPS